MVALGAVPRTVPVPGLAEHALSFKSLADAINLRNHVLRRLEAADAALDEEHAARAAVVRLRRRRLRGRRGARRAVRPRRRRDAPLPAAARRATAVGARGRGPEDPARDPVAARRVRGRELDERGVEIHVGTTLESVDADEAVLGDGTRDPDAHARLDGGRAGEPAAARARRPARRRGRVEVDELLRVAGPSVWALGDCARVPNTRSPTPDPPTCQHALRQARRLAKNLAGDPQPYGYRMLGQVATLGRYKGIADVLGLRLRGFPGWFVTRSYHLYQLPLARGAARRRRLDGVAPLPPRPRGARHARAAERLEHCYGTGRSGRPDLDGCTTWLRRLHVLRHGR